jgi:hypothetical protein
MINVRKRISQLFDEYSHNVVYVRRDPRFRCECYVERSGEPSPSCSKCFGTGNVVTIERVRARRKVATIASSLPTANENAQAGNMTPTGYTYYFEYDVKPIANDLILEVIWDVNGVPRYIKEKYSISVAEPKFGYKGRVEFYQVYVQVDQKGANDDTALTEY